MIVHRCSWWYNSSVGIEIQQHTGSGGTVTTVSIVVLVEYLCSGSDDIVVVHTDGTTNSWYRDGTAVGVGIHNVSSGTVRVRRY